MCQTPKHDVLLRDALHPGAKCVHLVHSPNLHPLIHPRQMEHMYCHCPHLLLALHSHPQHIPVHSQPAKKQKMVLYELHKHKDFIEVQLALLVNTWSACGARSIMPSCFKRCKRLAVLLSRASLYSSLVAGLPTTSSYNHTNHTIEIIGLMT